MELFLFIGRFFLFVNTWTAIFAEWLIRGTTEGVDKSHLIFNVDCRVSASFKPLSQSDVISKLTCVSLCVYTCLSNLKHLSADNSIRNILLNGPCHTRMQSVVYWNYVNGLMKNSRIPAACDHTSLSRYDSQRQTISG